MGELGLFYRLSPLALVGGSFIDHGGQNPIEAVQLGCAVITGPSMFNFAEVMADFSLGGVSLSVGTSGGLSEKLTELLSAPEHIVSLAHQQKKIVTSKASVIDTVFEALICCLPTSE